MLEMLNFFLTSFTMRNERLLISGLIRSKKSSSVAASSSAGVAAEWRAECATKCASLLISLERQRPSRMTLSMSIPCPEYPKTSSIIIFVRTVSFSSAGLSAERIAVLAEVVETLSAAVFPKVIISLMTASVSPAMRFAKLSRIFLKKQYKTFQQNVHKA